ncbi:hypothetical protein NDU88_003803 [Pleurodeles waltl]|uniref:Uncharacterized protein n=1 Tax=Pleurodeles waltl TaxID=8319 RepID=A0AAV7LJJ3_PLEWA|nr:hypothetical protein NDU88_003803 [Pleurodeles waltl]
MFLAPLPKQADGGRRAGKVLSDEVQRLSTSKALASDREQPTGMPAPLEPLLRARSWWQPLQGMEVFYVAGMSALVSRKVTLAPVPCGKAAVTLPPWQVARGMDINTNPTAREGLEGAPGSSSPSCTVKPPTVKCATSRSSHRAPSRALNILTGTEEQRDKISARKRQTCTEGQAITN